MTDNPEIDEVSLLKVKIAFLEEEVRRRDIVIDQLRRRRVEPLKLDPNAKDSFRRPFRG